MIILPMTETYAKKMCLWQYPEPYTFYNLVDDPYIIKELLSDDYYAVVTKDGMMYGFYAFGKACRISTITDRVYRDSALDFGLGLHPDFTGKGYGQYFVEQGLAFGYNKYKPVRFRLTVADFNKRAQVIYQRAGFETIGSLVATSRKVKFQIMQTPRLKKSPYSLDNPPPL